MPAVKTAAADIALAANVDELGALEKEFAPFKPKADRIEALRKAIRAHYDAKPADQPFEAKGERFIVSVGPRAEQRKIHFPKLVKLIGAARFSKFATCTLERLTQFAPEAEIAVVEKEKTGARSLKVFERGGAA